MKTYILLLFLITTLLVKGQITFEKIYNFTEIMYTESVIQESDSGFMIAGYGWSTNYSGYDGAIFKTNKYGDSIWLKQSGFVENDHYYDIIKTNDNGYAFTGDIHVGYSDEDLNLVKTDSNGNIVWSTNFGGGNWENGYSLLQTDNNDFIMAGYSNSINGTGPQPYDFYIIKANSNGNLMWETKLGGTQNEYAYSVCTANNNSCIVAGTTSSYGVGNNIYLAKLDSNGNIVWTKTYENGSSAKSIHPTLDGNYYVIATNQLLGNPQQIVALKINEDGDTLWSKTYSGTESYYASYGIPSSDGGFAITGYTYTNTSTGSDILLIKTDSDGNKLWTKTYGDIANEYGNCVKQTNDGGYIITGDGSNNSIGQFTKLIKTDSLGCVKPIIDSISGQLNVSLYDTIYYHSIDWRGEDYNWITSYGEIVSGQGSNTVAIVWNQIGTDTIEVYVSNGCGLDSMSMTINIDTCVSPLISPIYGDTDVYLYDIEDYYVSLIEGKNPVSYLWNVVCGSILSGQHTPSIVVEWDHEGFGSIAVTATNECGTDTQIIENIPIIFSTVYNKEISSFSIYPNPTKGYINIENHHDIRDYKIEIFDIHGRLINSTTWTINNNQIDLSSLQNGTYFIKIIVKNEINVKKVIKY